jgi:hypothetical protein
VGLEGVPVGVKVLDGTGRNAGLDGTGRNAGFHRGLRNAQRHFRDQPRVERLRNQVIGTEAQLRAPVCGSHLLVGLFHDQVRQGFDAGNLHCRVDVGSAHVQGATKDVREYQHVVDLVGIVGAACTYDRVGPHFAHQFRPDLRLRIGKRHDQRALGHAFDMLGLKNAWGRQPQEHIGAVDYVVEDTGVAIDRVALFIRIHVLAAAIDDAVDVTEGHLFRAQTHGNQQVHASQGSGAGAGPDQAHILDVLADQAQPVAYGGGDADGCAVLVVVHHRYRHTIAQLALDVETLGGLDVLEIYAPERGFQGGDDVDEFVRIGFVDLDVENVDTRELLEQPSPSTAVPFVTTPTRLPRVV